MISVTMVSQTDPRATKWIIHSVYSLGTMSSLVMFSIVITEYGLIREIKDSSVGRTKSQHQFNGHFHVRPISAKDVDIRNYAQRGLPNCVDFLPVIPDGNYE